MDIDIMLMIWMDKYLSKFLIHCRYLRDCDEVKNIPCDIDIRFTRFIDFLDRKESGDLKFIILNEIKIFDFYTKAIDEVKRDKKYLKAALSGYYPGKVYENGQLIFDLKE